MCIYSIRLPLASWTKLSATDTLLPPVHDVHELDCQRFSFLSTLVPLINIYLSSLFLSHLQKLFSFSLIGFYCKVVIFIRYGGFKPQTHRDMSK
jgi:hypothetical protein